MKIVEPLIYNSFEDLTLNLDKVKEKYFSDSIVLIRGLTITDEQHLSLTKLLGDLMGWTPNSSASFNHKYHENHNSNKKLKNAAISEIILGWHMEHSDYDIYSPLVAGVWNMHTFKCESNSGMTYFMDSRKVYNFLFNDKEKDFLRSCWYTWDEVYPNNAEVKNKVKLVNNHWITGEEQIRLEMQITPPNLRLDTYENRVPTNNESKYFEELINRFKLEHYKNEEFRIIQKWNEGDILIPDLYSMAHAVTGGFSPENRKFTGLWCYINSPENLQLDSVHPSWR